LKPVAKGERLLPQTKPQITEPRWNEQSSRASPRRSSAKRLGHSKITITLDVYSHVLPSMGRGAADLLGALLHG